MSFASLERWSFPQSRLVEVAAEAVTLLTGRDPLLPQSGAQQVRPLPRTPHVGHAWSERQLAPVTAYVFLTPAGRVGRRETWGGAVPVTPAAAAHLWRLQAGASPGVAGTGAGAESTPHAVLWTGRGG